MNSIQTRLTPDQINSEIRDIKRRMRRFKETGDLKRLHRLQIRPLCLETDIKLLKEAMAKAAPIFRRSYAYDAFLEALALGKPAKGHPSQ